MVPGNDNLAIFARLLRQEERFVKAVLQQGLLDVLGNLPRILHVGQVFLHGPLQLLALPLLRDRGILLGDLERLGGVDRCLRGRNRSRIASSAGKMGRGRRQARGCFNGSGGAVAAAAVRCRPECAC